MSNNHRKGTIVKPYGNCLTSMNIKLEDIEEAEVLEVRSVNGIDRLNLKLLKGRAHCSGQFNIEGYYSKRFNHHGPIRKDDTFWVVAKTMQFVRNKTETTTTTTSSSKPYNPAAGAQYKPPSGDVLTDILALTL